jgi:dTDP-4-amino-4,6-dideoxygalactose transaminase
MRKIEFARPIIGEEEKQAVIECLSSPQLVHGPRSLEFEESFAAFMGGGFATSTSSATTALQLAYLTLGIGSGDEVIVPSLTHVATANAVLSVGAKPVFVDINSYDGNISVDQVTKAITPNTKAICVVHFLGVPVDMNEIMKIAKSNNLFVVEDCALALGARVEETHVGLIGDFGAFSFYPAKHITTGEGGMLVSKEANLINLSKKIKAFYYDKNVGDRKIPGLYDIVGFGLNLRMSEIAATLGIVQLTRISGFLEERKHNSEVLAQNLGKSIYGNLLPNSRIGAKSANYCASFVLEPEYAEKRNTIASQMNELGIGTSIYYPIALPLSAFYKSNPALSKTISYNNADYVANSNIALGVGPHLEESDMSYIAENFASVLEKVLA